MCEVGVKLALLVVILVFLSGCSTKSALVGDHLILKKNSYQIITDDDKVNTKSIKKELKDLVLQIPQKKSWLNPRTWDKELTIFSRDDTEEAVAVFTKYLHNRKGFYQAQVKYEEEVTNRNIHILYTIDLGPRHYIASVHLSSPDSTLLTLFESVETQSLILPGAPIDARTFEREQARLINAAKNNGYADFSPNYIEYRGDSSSHNVDVTIFIYPPYPIEEHRQFSIGDIHIYTEHPPSKNPIYQRSDTLENKSFYSKSEDFVVSPKVLSKVIPLKKGDLFSRRAEIRTNQNLTKLSPYRFITIDPFILPGLDSIYNYNIFLTPQERKWIFDIGGNLFFSVLNSTFTNQDLLGFSGNVGFENRNFRNKAVRHQFGIEGSLEVEVPSARLNTVSIQFNNSFELPGIVDIFNTGHLFNKIGLLTDESYKNLNYDGTTKFNFSVGLTSILDFYDLNFAEASLSYTFQPSPLARYTFIQTGINVLETDIKPGFEDILADNPLLDKSFESYLLTGILFRELTIFRRSKETVRGNYFSFIGTVESSGLENYLLNGALQLVNVVDDSWEVAGLKFSQFLRLEGDLRFNQKVKSRASFAMRMNFGMILPYGSLKGDDTRVVAPFVKQFFVGGPNSIRGWQLRELGPGTYVHKPNPIVTNEPFFQAADIKFELNAEYRFDLFYVFEGALFVDAGNVWTLKNDPQRVGSNFSSSFLNELAVSAGWGLRLDFDYFLFRFDFGYKMRTPFVDEQGKRWFNQPNGLLGNINFAINYPF